VEEVERDDRFSRRLAQVFLVEDEVLGEVDLLEGGTRASRTPG